jgi:hypothetical protein|tara:strand:+ start:16 stop:183 length:168 start_codon:yes stop_codon:yes gene_type:complete
MYGGTIGRTHGDKKLRIPAKNEIIIDVNNPASKISIPNIFFLKSIFQKLISYVRS